MTYRIERFDNDLEALSLTAIVRDGVVDIDWLHDHDDADSYSQRCLARVKTILDPDAASYPPQTAFLMMRLYRRGDVSVSGMSCADGYRDEAMRLAKKAVIDMYDSVYPDVAQAARAFVEESVDIVKRFAADDTLPRLAVAAGKQLAADQFLSHMLDEAKADLAKTGEVEQRIGWFVNQGMALIPIGTPPFEKYRYFRAIGEVARRVNADAVVYVADSYRLSPNGERTGQEYLQVWWVNPDGSCVSRGLAYARRKHPLVPQEIIDFLPDTTAVRLKVEENQLVGIFGEIGVPVDGLKCA